MGRRLVVSRWENDLTMSDDDVQWLADSSIGWCGDVVDLVSSEFKVALQIRIWHSCEHHIRRYTRHSFAPMLSENS